MAEDQQSALSTVARRLAQAYYELGGLEEADTWAGRAAEVGTSDNAMTQMQKRVAPRRCSGGQMYGVRPAAELVRPYRTTSPEPLPQEA